MAKQTGKLYGIGVGPGDPDLIPVKSVKILQKVDLVFAASSSKNNHSQAVNIAAAHIPAATRVIVLPFPMTKDMAAKKKAWEENAATIIASLESGRNAAFLTLGDTMTYSTCGYIIQAVQALAPHIEIETIPGITSYQAAAATANTPLMEGEESLLILSGVQGGDNLRKHMNGAENVVFLKAYKNMDDIVASVEEAGLIENSYGIVNCSLEDQEIVPDIRELQKRDPKYWTLIVAKKGGKAQPKQPV
jgi:precorrin-2/cobalt-factor-2 C20-methyltransferase